MFFSSDVKDIGYVVNYEWARFFALRYNVLMFVTSMPNGIEDYIHRIGRTGRAGRKGTAYRFVFVCCFVWEDLTLSV